MFEILVNGNCHILSYACAQASQYATLDMFGWYWNFFLGERYRDWL